MPKVSSLFYYVASIAIKMFISCRKSLSSTMATTDEPKITMDTIRRCAAIICQCMDRESLRPYLLQCSLLTNDEMYHFTNTNKSPSESNNYLIQILENKDSDSAQKLYQCLQMGTGHTGHSQIVECLRNAAKLQGNFQDVIKLLIYHCFSGTTCKGNAEKMNSTSSKDESEKGVYIHIG